MPVWRLRTARVAVARLPPTEFNPEAFVPEPEIITAEVASEERELSPNEKIAASRWQVLVLLFLAAGPLALPVLVRSPRFSRFSKVVLFLLVLVQTALVVVLVLVFTRWFFERMEQLRQMY